MGCRITLEWSSKKRQCKTVCERAAETDGVRKVITDLLLKNYYFKVFTVCCFSEFRVLAFYFFIPCVFGI